METNNKKPTGKIEILIGWVLAFVLLIASYFAWQAKLYVSFSIYLFICLLLLPPLKKMIIRILPFMSHGLVKYPIVACLFFVAIFIKYADYYLTDDHQNEPKEEYSSRGLEISNSTNSETPGGKLNFGKYFAIIIGEGQYASKSIPKLERPPQDAHEFYEVLKKYYAFDSIKLMTDASKSDIMKTLMSFRKLLGNNDNLLIFYAGHGHEDNSNKQGYWLPINAEPDDPTNWISNSDIIDQINPIPAKHKLVISDACFSGGLFTARSTAINAASQTIQELYNSNSCTAMTSGAHTEVPDKSVFLHYLLDALQTDTVKYVSARNLFYSFCDKATSNSKIKNLIPQYGPILNSGNNGGDFVFIRK